MTIQQWFQIHRRDALIGGASALGVLLFFIAVTLIGRPTFNDPPSSIKESKVTVRGKASPKSGLAVFDASGNAVVIVNVDEKGEFTVIDLPIGEGKNVFVFRVVKPRWRVSFPRTLVIQKDTTAPAVSVNALSGATVTGSNTIISGKAEPGSTVTVNGVKTTVNAEGTWTATVALKPGENAVTVAATDAAGNTTTQTQTVTYQPTAPDSQTGTATVTATSTTLSPGSQPAPTTTSTAGSPSAPAPAPAPSPTTSPATSPTAAPQAPAPAPQPLLAITSSAWVSNASPNAKANETIYTKVLNNYGQPVTNASVIANVYFKTGMANYSLRHVGGGTYSVSFKLNDRYASGYRVNVETVSRFSGFTSTAQTSFTPQ